MGKNEETLNTYEKIAQQYAEKNNGNDNVRPQRELFAGYVKDGLIYDIGCGTGRDTEAFRQLGFEVKGYDGSEAMLSVAKKMYPSNTFAKMNMLDKQWKIDRQANGIWACASLLHFDKHQFEEVFIHLTQLLKQGGIFYFSVKIKPVLSTETIEGRFFQYYTKEWLDAFILKKHHFNIHHYEENTNGSDCFASYFLKKEI